jgi:hypothetical protein
MSMYPDEMNQSQGPGSLNALEADTGAPADHAVFYEEGAATEDPPDDPATPFPGLPPGVHPFDPSTDGGDALAAKPDTYGSKVPSTGKPPYDTENYEAVPVFTRPSHDWTARTVIINATTGATQLVGRQKGKGHMVISVPAVASVAAALPVVIGPDEGDVMTGLSGWIIYPGESFTIDTEGAIWAGALGNNATAGPVRVAATMNPPGGGLGVP